MLPRAERRRRLEAQVDLGALLNAHFGSEVRVRNVCRILDI